MLLPSYTISLVAQVVAALVAEPVISAACAVVEEGVVQGTYSVEAYLWLLITKQRLPAFQVVQEERHSTLAGTVAKRHYL